MLSPALRARVELLRLPALATVPGDVLLGAYAAGPAPSAAAVGARVAGSGLIYLGGMALNDWADREVDRRERPSRPIPSGRVGAAEALALGAGLTAAGLAASRAGGRGGARVAAALAATAWAYDLGLKDTRLGPVAMAAARALDVLHGAGSMRRRAALAPAALVGAHVLSLTLASRHEATGAGPEVARRALVGTEAVTVGALALCTWGAFRSAAPPARLAAAAMGLAAFRRGLRRAGRAAVADPGPAGIQRLVGASVLALVPLQASLLTATAPPAVPAGLIGGWAAARAGARRAAVT